MSLQFFGPKIFGSFLIGGCALCGGGVIYWYQMPRTWKELLVKEGFIFLSSDGDYKGMFNDQKDEQIWKDESELQNANDGDVKTKAGDYCQNKLKGELPSTGNYEETKKKLILFCTSDGIKSVKARIVQSKTSTLNWITDSDTDKWKAVFAVYRYDPRFIDWLKKDDAGNGSLSSSSTINDNYNKLKTACGKLLKKNHKEVEGDHIKYGSWWCVELGYSTIKGKIQQTDSTWSEKQSGDNDWQQLKEKWKDTEVVKKWANKAKGQNEEQELSEDSLKELCNSTNVNAQLSDNDSYQEKYLVIKSVCKSGGSS